MQARKGDRGALRFVFYGIERDNLAATLTSFMQAVCPVSQGLKKESKALGARKGVG